MATECGGGGGGGGCGSHDVFNEGVSPSKPTKAPNYGGRVGPAPVYRALKIYPATHQTSAPRPCP